MDCPSTYQAVLEHIGPSHIDLLIDSIYWNICFLISHWCSPWLSWTFGNSTNVYKCRWFHLIWRHMMFMEKCYVSRDITFSVLPIDSYLREWLTVIQMAFLLLGCEIHVKFKSRVDGILGVVGSVAICHVYLTSFTNITWKRSKCCFIDIKWVVSGQGWGLLIQFSPFRYFRIFSSEFW